MDPAEVLAIEVKQFVGDGMKTLVPRVLGQTETERRKKHPGTRPGKQWDELMFMTALCIRLPKQHNPLAFQWRDQPFEIRSILLSEINDGRGLSLLIDINETMDNGLFVMAIYTYRDFPRREGLTVEQSLASLDRGVTAEMGADPRDTDPCINLSLSSPIGSLDPRPPAARIGVSIA